MHENSKLKPGVDMLGTEIVSDIQNNFVYNMFSPCSSKRRASDKDLPVQSSNVEQIVKWKSIADTSISIALDVIFNLIVNLIWLIIWRNITTVQI